MININWRPERKELRQFAGIWLAFFSILAAWWWIDTGSTAVARWLATSAVVVGVPGLIAPAIVRPIYLVWMAVAFPIGWTISHLLLGVIYYLILTPIGLLLRATGNDPMNRRLEREKATYWVPHRTGDDAAGYFRQY